MSTQDRLEINWFNVAGASLGAVSSALVLSTLGAAGTLVGAALGSLCITVGGALYSHSMKVTKDKVAAAKSITEARKARSRESVMAGGSSVSPQPWAETPQEDAAPDTTEAKEPLRTTLRGLPWKRIAALTGALFAITLTIIVAFEMSTGRAVSTFTGGTSDTSVSSTFMGAASNDSSTTDDSQPGDGQQDQGPAQDGQQDQAPAQDGQQDQGPAQDGQQDQAPAQDGQQDQAPEQQQEEPAPQQQEAPAPQQQEPPAPQQQEAPAPQQQAPQQAPQE